jgi:hypothetical protein
VSGRCITAPQGRHNSSHRRQVCLRWGCRWEAHRREGRCREARRRKGHYHSTFHCVVSLLPSSLSGEGSTLGRLNERNPNWAGDPLSDRRWWAPLVSVNVRRRCGARLATSALHLGPTSQFCCQSAGKCESVHIASNLGKSHSFCDSNVKS